MPVARHLPILFVASLAIASAAPRHVFASAQSEPAVAAAPEDSADKSDNATKQVAQRIIAQLGLAAGLQSNILKSQLQIIQALQGKAGVCFSADDDDDHHHHEHDNADLARHDDDGGHHGGTQGGGSFKLLSLRLAASAFDADVEVYYDNDCKKVFVHSALQVQPLNTYALSLKEKANFYKPNGAALGKVTLSGTGARQNNLLDLNGSGTFMPAGGGAAVKFGVDCSYPAVLPVNKPFVCTGGVVASLNALKMDFGLTSTITTKVKKVCSGFVGSFYGPVRVVTGAFGKLGLSVKPNSVSVTGPSKPLGSATISGSAQLNTTGPSPTSWTITDVELNIAVETYVSDGSKPGFKGAVRDTRTHKTLATFSVDQSGNGSIVFTSNQKSAITGWIMSN